MKGWHRVIANKQAMAEQTGRKQDRAKSLAMHLNKTQPQNYIELHHKYSIIFKIPASR